MEPARKFKIIVNSKECGTCSGPTPSAVAKKVVKKLCGSSSKVVKFSLKECKRGCERVCGPYQGRMEKLDRHCKRDGKTITHRVVCGKVRKMRGGRDLILENFRKKKNYGPFRIEGYGMFKIPYIYFGLILIREESPTHSEFYKYVIYNTKHFGGDVRISQINSITGRVEDLIIDGKNNKTYRFHEKLIELYDELKKNPKDYKRIQKFIKNKLNNENRRAKVRGNENEHGRAHVRGNENENEHGRAHVRENGPAHVRENGPAHVRENGSAHVRERGKGNEKRKLKGKNKNNLNTEFTVDDFSKNGYIGGFEVKKIGDKYYFFIGQSEDTYSLVIISYMENGKEQIEVKMLDGDEIIDVEFGTFATILDRISTEKDNFDLGNVSDEMFGLKLILKKFYDNMSFHPTKKEELNNNDTRPITRKSINPNKGLSIASYFEILTMFGPYKFITKYILNRRDKLLEHHRAVVANKIAKKFVHDNLSQLIRNNNSNKQSLIDEFLEEINIKQKFKLGTEKNMLMHETEEKAIDDCQRLVMREISILSKKNSLNQI